MRHFSSISARHCHRADDLSLQISPPRCGRRGVLLASLATIAGCKLDQAKVNRPMTMKDIHSGYASGPADWLAFLRCWRETVQARLARRPFYSGLGALPPDVNVVADRPGDIAETVARLQHRLKLQLPRSYLDFAQARNGRDWVIEVFAEQLQSGEFVGGVLPLNAIGMFAETDPATYATWTNQPSIGRAITPQEYYRYGFQADCQHRQNLALFHAEALAHMIKVGDRDQGGVLSSISS